MAFLYLPRFNTNDMKHGRNSISFSASIPNLYPGLKELHRDELCGIKCAGENCAG